MTRLAVVSLSLAVMLVLVVGAGSLGAAVSACPSTNVPNELVLAGGSGQTAQLGKPFGSPLEVALANTNGCPLTGNLAGHNVNFDAPGSGASGVFAGSGSREAVVGTNAQGVATAPAFTANFTVGSYTVDAHSDFGTVELSLANTASGLAASITAAGGTPQEATVNGPYGQPLQVRVSDANGSPVQGAVVTFSIVPGPTGAGGVFLGQATATSDSNGIATSLPLQANGSPGRFTAVASTDGVASVAVFSLDNNAAVDSLSAVGATTQSATVATSYARPLAARLLDQAGQPVEGASVTFTLGATGATFIGGAAQAIVVTDANGVATTPMMLAGDTPGEFIATATVAGSATTLTFTLRILAARLVADDPPRSATIEHRYARRLTVHVHGAFGAPVAGVPVTFTVGKATNNASAAFPDGTNQATATTNRAGVASSPTLTANGVAGAFKAIAAVSGSEPVGFTLRNTAAQPAAITVGAADGSSITAGLPLPIRLAVTVTDKEGNPVAGIVVRFAAPTSGPGGAFIRRAQGARTVRVRTNADGVAIAPPFTANHTEGGYAVEVRAGSARAAFALVNRP